MFHPFFFSPVNPNPSCFFYSLPRVQSLNNLRFFFQEEHIQQGKCYTKKGVIFFRFPHGFSPWILRDRGNLKKVEGFLEINLVPAF